MSKIETQDYTPLPEPIPITEQVWPEGTKPLVCTRTMTYNHENYIRECIEGILMQKTTFPVRVCIHDDASTDKTAEIVREYQEKYPNLIWAYYQKENTFLHQKKNEMRSEFMGWAKVGSYEAPCEGDDYWTDSLKLQEQVIYLENNPLYSLCGHDVDIVWENLKEKLNFYPKPLLDANFIDIINYKPYMHLATMVYRNYDRSEIRVIGHGMLITYLAVMGRVKYIEKKMAVKRKNPTGITQNNSIKKWRKRNNSRAYKISVFYIDAKKNKLLNDGESNILKKKVVIKLKNEIKANVKSFDVKYIFYNLILMLKVILS